MLVEQAWEAAADAEDFHKQRSGRFSLLLLDSATRLLSSEPKSESLASATEPCFVC